MMVMMKFNCNRDWTDFVACSILLRLLTTQNYTKNA